MDDAHDVLKYLELMNEPIPNVKYILMAKHNVIE